MQKQPREARGFLPVTMEEVRERGWDRPDFVYVTGDAYVDHPSFGLAIISRVLERARLDQRPGLYRLWQAQVGLFGHGRGD